MSNFGPANKTRRNMFAAALAAGATVPVMARLVSSNSSESLMVEGRMPQPGQLFQGQSWNPPIGSQVFTYAAGTFTPKTTYQDVALTVANTNPIVANARGEVSMFGTGAYRVILKDAGGNIIHDVDNVESSQSLVNSLRQDLDHASGAALVGFTQAAAGAVARPLQSELRERPISVKQFGAVPDWNGKTGTDNTAAFQAALNFAAMNGRSVFIPVGSYRITRALVMDTNLYATGLIMYGEGRNSIIYQTGINEDAIHFSTTQFLQNSGLRDLVITCAMNAGHCVNILFGCTTCFVSNVDLVALNPGKSCVYGDYSRVGGGIFDTKFSGGSWYLNPKSTVGGFVIRAKGTIFNENMFENLRCYQAHSSQFFDITTVVDGAIWLVNNSWKNINFEICKGGGIKFSSFKNCKFENISFWDAGGNYTNHLVDMVAGSAYESTSSTFINVTRNGDKLGPSVRDIRIVSGQDTMFINCYTPVDHAPSYDFGSKRVTVIGRMYGVENKGNTTFIQPEMFSGPSLAADTIHGGVLRIGARGMPESATVSYASGFFQITPLPVNSGVVLNSTNAGGAQSKLVFSSRGLYPIPDNAVSLGVGAQRWSQVHAATGAINTSDEHSKTQVGSIDPAVLRAWAKVEFCQYKFRDAVALKGDDARWHFGVVAQRVKEAFESEGLDAFAYGLLCYDEWPAAPAMMDASGAVVVLAREAGKRYGIRYEEALALECAYLRSCMLTTGTSR